MQPRSSGQATRWDYLILVAILVIAAALRLRGITQPLVDSFS